MINNKAIAILSCGRKTLPMTVSSIIRYFPKGIPTYIMSLARKQEQKELLKSVVKMANRAGYDIEIWPLPSQLHYLPNRHSRAIISFCEYHPQYEYVLKIDDDILYASEGCWQGYQDAYNAFEDVLLSTMPTPLQYYMMNIYKERCGIVPDVYTTDTSADEMYNHLKAYPAEVVKIWEQTTPPSRMLPLLRKGERFLVVPNDRIYGEFSIHNIYFNRKDLLVDSGIYGEYDEPRFNAYRMKHDKKVAVDTHNLAYHYAWCTTREFADKELLPKVRAMNFWKYNGFH